MNPWDLFTYAMAAVLGLGSLLVFVAFLFDLKDVLRIQR
jgi:hypothetical protein